MVHLIELCTNYVEILHNRGDTAHVLLFLVLYSLALVFYGVFL